MVDPEIERTVTLEQVATKMNVHPRTVWNWTKRENNPLEAAKAGGVLRTTWTCVREFLQMTGQKPKSQRRSNGSAKKALKERHGI